MFAFEDKYFVGLCGHRRNLPLLCQAELDRRVSGLIREIRRERDELLDITWAFTEHLTVALDPGMCLETSSGFADTQAYSAIDTTPSNQPPHLQRTLQAGDAQ